jgi:hypothetical protein
MAGMAGSMRRLEVQQVEDLLHRDLCAKPVEIDPWHGFFLWPWRGGWWWLIAEDRSVPCYL